MGVPALFRWLSKKYPKIVERVVEDEAITISGANGETVTLPPDMNLPNPNGFETDNLYLDMNGIVHPCTHPEGKPAPQTEEEMMIEIFAYTERIVNMMRPRKLLFMAIDGVAPRAKMNQQRSRRFRSAQDARAKAEEREAGIAMFEAMGRTVSEDTKNQIAWDSNAITPGTPFMDLLASSLRYWVVQKMNTDSYWRTIQVIVSDASVPGEGEHKIVDYIRRQRVNPGHDPNTQHVIYGLDADLIMLALATHEPYFRVLREDVFAQDKKTTCRICGQNGHYAAQCTGGNQSGSQQRPTEKAQSAEERKPFIFLDVAVLREYLQVELRSPQQPFPFDMEKAVDDWVFLIFFVGNDFLPHLPSLEIREGAIDTLLKIWKSELPRMGGYLTNHGDVVLARAQILMEGLARCEDEIFRKRRESEERQNQNVKRRRVEGDVRLPQLSSSTSENPAERQTLPRRPTVDSHTLADTPLASPGVTALGGSNADVVNNRAAIRMANMSAAESLKAELAAKIPLGRKTVSRINAQRVSSESLPVEAPPFNQNTQYDDTATVDAPQAATTTSTSHPTPARDIPPIPEHPIIGLPLAPPASQATAHDDQEDGGDDMDTSSEGDTAATPRGSKRKADVLDESFDNVDGDPTIGDQTVLAASAQRVYPDGIVEESDTVRLWEPGYKERYYGQKFDIGPDDVEFRRKVTKSYLEGLVWVLRYYYQGTPSWQWYYPYHFAPFAADFRDVAESDIKFTLGAPFKPFEQLMGVFPAASRAHLPVPFQELMIDADSPILDFYPETFRIDMNGKKLAWQGVALLPFIDPDRLLAAMAARYPELTDEERRRNRWGNNLMLLADGSPLYDVFCELYTKKRSHAPVPLDPSLSKGVSGSVMADPACVPGSTYISPFVDQDLRDIHDDRSISALYFYPKQVTPHRSVLLPGVRDPRPRLTQYDLELGRRGGRGRGNGYSGESMPRTPSTPNGHTSRSMEYRYSYPLYGGPGAYKGSNMAPPYALSRSAYQSYTDTYSGRGAEVTSYGGRGSYIHRGSSSTTYRGNGRGRR